MGGNTVRRFRIKIAMGWSDTGFFSEKYRVVAVEAERLTIKGIVTGTVLTITNSDPATPLTAEQYPLGKLIALSDPRSEERRVGKECRSRSAKGRLKRRLVD